MSDYVAATLAILGGAGMAVAFSLLARYIGEYRPTRAKQIPYEAGSDPIGNPRARVPVRFYSLAILFVVFDVEVAFLYPWALNYAPLSCAGPLEGGVCRAGPSAFGLAALLVFVGVLVVALAYVWRKRAIGWE